MVLATQQYESARKDSAVYARIMEVSAARYRKGREPAATYRAAQQELERKQVKLREAWAVLVEAGLELRRYVNLSGATALTTGIDGIRDYLLTFHQDNYTIRSLEIDQQIATLQQEGLRRQLLPSFKLNAYWGEQYFDNQFRLTRGSAWYGNSYVNLVLRVPLSAYLTARPALRKAALRYSLTAKQLEEEQRIDHIHNQQREVKIRVAQQKVNALKRIADLGRKTSEEQEAAYRAGRLLLSDYHQSLAAYHQAQLDVWQAEYDLIGLLLD